MIGGLKPYLRYRDSGLPWLGSIPEHWELPRIKTLAKLKSGESITAEAIEPTGPYRVFGGNGVRGYSDEYTHEGEFVLIGRQGALCGNVNYATGRFWASEHAVVANPIQPYNLRWFGETLRTMDLNQYSMSAAQPGLAVERMQNLRLPLPPRSEQEAIGAFLHAVDRRVNRFIRAKRRLIELLNEQKQAIIHQAVTRGLDPDVPLKPSGVDWLGDIPAHWDTRRLKSVSHFITSGSRGWAAYYADDGPVFLRIGNISTTDIDLRLSKIQRVSPPVGAEGERTKVEPNDLLISITAQMGAVGVVPPAFETAYVNQHTALVRLQLEKVNPRWAAYCLLSPLGKQQFSVLTNGGTKDGLTLSDVGSTSILFPSMAEQVQTVEWLDHQLIEMRQAAQSTAKEIELIQEYRTRLIADVVTGKLDVRDTAARMPQTGDEETDALLESDAFLGDDDDELSEDMDGAGEMTADAAD